MSRLEIEPVTYRSPKRTLYELSYRGRFNSIGGRIITNFRFADDIVVNAEEEEEAGVLVDRLDTTTTRYK